MVKNILAFFGLVFLTGVIIISVLALGIFLDSFGLYTLPEPMTFLRTPIALPGQPSPQITVRVEDVGEIEVATAEWTNPLDLLPTATVTPIATAIPTVTNTPIPPLDPAVYRAETMVRLRAFADALDRWLRANNELGENKALLQDAEWRADVQTTLADVAASGQALSEIGPPPVEYSTIDALLNQVGPEAVALQDKYSRAMDTGNSGYFSAASEHFSRIREYLTQAVAEMAAAGWSAQ